jgi:hypothetical protein
MSKKRRKGRQSIKMLNPVRLQKSAGTYIFVEDRELNEAEFQDLNDMVKREFGIDLDKEEK